MQIRASSRASARQMRYCRFFQWTCSIATASRQNPTPRNMITAHANPSAAKVRKLHAHTVHRADSCKSRQFVFKKRPCMQSHMMTTSCNRRLATVCESAVDRVKPSKSAIESTVSSISCRFVRRIEQALDRCLPLIMRTAICTCSWN